MTVAPLYDDYPGLHDTGVELPVEIPPWCAALHKPPSLPPARLQQQLNADGLYAGYWRTRHRGVDHVFVRHAYYHAAEVYGDSGSYTAHASNGAAVRHNILCQAALAAPVLLWDLANLPSKDPASQEQHGMYSQLLTAGGQALDDLLLTMVEDASASTPAEDDPAALWGAVLDTAAIQTRWPPGMRPRPAPPCSPTRTLLATARRAVRVQAGGAQEPQQGPPRLVFVANDWPTAPALLRLGHVHRRPSRRTRSAEDSWRRLLLGFPHTVPATEGGADLPSEANKLPSFDPDGKAPGMIKREHVTMAQYYQKLLGLRALLRPRLSRAKGVLCIHNFAYQGAFEKVGTVESVLCRVVSNKFVH